MSKRFYIEKTKIILSATWCLITAIPLLVVDNDIFREIWNYWKRIITRRHKR